MSSSKYLFRSRPRPRVISRTAEIKILLYFDPRRNPSLAERAQTSIFTDPFFNLFRYSLKIFNYISLSAAAAAGAGIEEVQNIFMGRPDM